MRRERAPPAHARWRVRQCRFRRSRCRTSRSAIVCQLQRGGGWHGSLSDLSRPASSSWSPTRDERARGGAARAHPCHPWDVAWPTCASSGARRVVGHGGPWTSARCRGRAGLSHPQARRRAGRGHRRVGSGQVDGRFATPTRRCAAPRGGVRRPTGGQRRSSTPDVAGTAPRGRSTPGVWPASRGHDARPLGGARPQPSRADSRGAPRGSA